MHFTRYKISNHHLGQSGSTCGLKEFKCDNGECILGRRECDGNSDCADGTDEHPQCGQCLVLDYPH